MRRSNNKFSETTRARLNFFLFRRIDLRVKSENAPATSHHCRFHRIDRSTTDIHKLVFPSRENGSIVNKLDISRIVRFWGWEVNSLAFEKK